MAQRSRKSTFRRRRRVVRKRTTFARRATRRPAMTRKRILNITSIKKHDNMRPVVIDPTGAVSQGVLQLGTLPGGGISPFGYGFTGLYTPTSRRIYDGSLANNAGESYRQRQLTYSKGYKETVNITLNTGASWRWRRIVFTLKGDDLFESPGNATWYDNNVNGMERAIVAPATGQDSLWTEIIFDGTANLDWSDRFSAKVDTSRVTLKYDKTRNLCPGNETGRSYTFKNWFPTGKNLLYNGDEAGVATNPNYNSTLGKAGMGDLYVLDIFGQLTGGTTAGMQFNPEGTYYWHEK